MRSGIAKKQNCNVMSQHFLTSWQLSRRRAQMNQCLVEGCDGGIKAKGYCLPHYKNFWRTGKPVSNKPNPHGSPVERFWRYIQKTEGCWLWIGHADKHGYGWLRISARQSPVHAHRFSYELHIGPIPPDKLVRHTCPG